MTSPPVPFPSSPRSRWKEWWAETGPHEEKARALVQVGDAPPAYSRFLDRFQKVAVRRALIPAGALAGRRVLDIGWGIGRWQSFWSEQGVRLMGIDLPGSLRRACRLPEKGPGPQYAAMVVQNLGWARDSFDGVSSITVLQHVPYGEQQRAIREIVRCVRPGGWILLYEHARRHADSAGPESTTFPHAPRGWERMFGQENCRLLSAERWPLMPLFMAYWGLRDPLVRLMKSRLVRPSAPDRPLEYVRYPFRLDRRGLSRALRFLDYLVYELLTWPSWILEYALLGLVPRSLPAGRLPLGVHQAFLFRKSEDWLKKSDK